MANKEKNLTKDYNELVKLIGDYLELEVIDNHFEVLWQDEKSDINIPDKGKGFGSIFDDDENLIIAKWLDELSPRSKKHTLNYILIREAFRPYLENELPRNHPYILFYEVVLQIISIVYKAETQKYRMTSSPIVTVRGRAEAYEEERMYQSQFWIFFLTSVPKTGLKAKDIFHSAIKHVKDFLAEGKDAYDLGLTFIRWMKTFLPTREQFGVPKYIKSKKHFPIIKAISALSHSEGSAQRIGEIVGKSYNTINIAFKEIIEDYNLIWWTNLNYLELRLYPFFIRITLSKPEYLTQLEKKFRQNRYFRYIKNTENNLEPKIIAQIVCPLKLYNQMVEYFERLSKKGIIKDYFMKQIREFRISYTISTKEFTPEIDTFRKLYSEEINEDCFKIVSLDEKYDITNVSLKTKKTAFDYDVLKFLSVLMARYPGKAHYMCRPLELIYELCEAKSIDSTNFPAVKDYVNQMEIRCKRLNLVNYYLHYREIVLMNFALIFEIEHSDKNLLNNIFTKLENICEMTRFQLEEKTILLYHEVKYESEFRKFVESILQDNEISFMSYQVNVNKNWGTMNIILLHELYDFENQKWIV